MHRNKRKIKTYILHCPSSVASILCPGSSANLGGWSLKTGSGGEGWAGRF